MSEVCSTTYKLQDMSKNSFFYGQSVFGQLISLIDRKSLKKIIFSNQSDRYNKGFDTWSHLVSMLFTAMGDCHSLREVASGFLGLKGKTSHFGMSKIPRRSTLSEANKKRSSKVFQDIYYSLLNQYGRSIPDSLYAHAHYKAKKMIDSTTISLFLGIFKCVGRPPKSGKHKGGVKVHTMLNSYDHLPELVWITDASKNDINFFNKICFEKQVIYLFDKGYVDYWKYRDNIERNGAFYVTRLRENATYTTIQENLIPKVNSDKILADQLIELHLRGNGVPLDQYQVRMVEVWDDIKKVSYKFITNIRDLEAVHIGELYSDRWEIELLFKQFKQNFPLKYFLGDNRNAIEIQIWCTLIMNLLITVLKRKVKKTWAFSNLVSFIRLHIFNYLHLIKFLNAPEKDWCDPPDDTQLQLNLT